MERLHRTEAVGRRLAHDVTQVIAGQSKRVYLRRGDTVGPEHLETLADMGKEHLLVLSAADGPQGQRVHENDAAAVLAHAAAGEGCDSADPVEGKCDVRARWDGLFLPDRAAIDRTNLEQAGHAALITRPEGTWVRAGERVAIARVFPAFVPGEVAQRLGQVPAALSVRPLRPLRAGVVVTGQEVAAGRVKDAFAPLLRDKLAVFGTELAEVRIVGDDRTRIAQAIRSLHAKGLDLLFATGGMAVDADDLTQAAIQEAGVEVRFAGVPMQPATLLLFGMLEGVPLFGVPAGVLYDPYSALDRLLPYVLAGVMPTAEMVLGMGVGGMLGGGGHRHERPGTGTPAAAP